MFASDDESEDEEAKRIKEENLAAYKKKKEGKVKPAAKSLVTLDVKPWGTCKPGRQKKWHILIELTLQMTKLI